MLLFQTADQTLKHISTVTDGLDRQRLDYQHLMVMLLAVEGEVFGKDPKVDPRVVDAFKVCLKKIKHHLSRDLNNSDFPHDEELVDMIRKQIQNVIKIDIFDTRENAVLIGIGDVVNDPEFGPVKVKTIKGSAATCYLWNSKTNDWYKTKFVTISI